MKELNWKYRKKNEPTDVLSFGNGLNEIFICPAVVEKQEGESFKKKLAEVLIHGILHILGEKHGEKMFKKQKKYLDIYG